MAEIKRTLKWFDITEYEKEAVYLREMHKQGWKYLKATIPGIYKFEKCEPGSWEEKFNQSLENVEKIEQLEKYVNDLKASLKNARVVLDDDLNVVEDGRLYTQEAFDLKSARKVFDLLDTDIVSINKAIVAAFDPRGPKKKDPVAKVAKELEIEPSVAKLLVEHRVSIAIGDENSIEQVKSAINGLISSLEVLPEITDDIEIDRKKKHNIDLMIDDDYKIIEITGKGYSGYLAVIYDPSRVSVVSTKNLGKSGQYLTKMAADNDALIATQNLRLGVLRVQERLHHLNAKRDQIESLVDLYKRML